MFYHSFTTDKLKEWSIKSKITNPILFNTKYQDNKMEKIIIYTSQPGWLIGKGGCIIDEYKSIFKEKFGEDIKIELVEVDPCYINNTKIDEEVEEYIIQNNVTRNDIASYLACVRNYNKMEEVANSCLKISQESQDQFKIIHNIHERMLNNKWFKFFNKIFMWI